MPLGERGQKELAVLLHGFEEVPLALEGQRLLHLTGAAGVVLGTEPQVLTWRTDGDTPAHQAGWDRLGPNTRSTKPLLPIHLTLIRIYT